jgi:hypothetical protein
MPDHRGAPKSPTPGEERQNGSKGNDGATRKEPAVDRSKSTEEGGTGPNETQNKV